MTAPVQNSVNTTQLLREQLVELLRGGFAPNVILLREFHADKTGIVLDGLFYSAYSLLEHMRARQQVLLRFMQNPEVHSDVWPDAHWPQNPQPESTDVWHQSINSFEHELEQMLQLVQNTETDLFTVQQNGKTRSWAALTNLHHNGYHIGQIKVIGRQLGVW